MRIKNKRRIIEMFFVVLTILIISLIVVLNNIILVSPVGVIYDTSPIFAWSGFDSEYRLLVDEDSNFENPIIDVVVHDNKFDVSKKLDFGMYYWKVISKDKESITGRFVIDSMVRMELDDKLRNKGNTPVLISGLTGSFVLDIDEEVDIGEGGEYTAEQI